MIGLLFLLLLSLLGIGSGSSSNSGSATSAPPVLVPAPRATLAQTIFHVDGKGLDPRKPIRLHEGQTLTFPHGTENVRLNRLECAHDVHAIPLRGGVSWRVPDLPTGEYLLSAVVLRSHFEYLVRVRSHSAPCPGG